MFSLQPPLGYLLTWTTYGTRLHGDERGSVDLAHNKRFTARLAASPERKAGSRLLLTQEPFVMDDRHRPVVDGAIRDHSRIRGWVLHAANVRTNHVHVVVTANSRPPEIVMAQFKDWGTRRLTTAKLIEQGRKVWTDHGSTPWLNTPEEFWAAIEYVLHGQ